MIDPVTAWLLKEVVAPDAYQRLVDGLRRSSWDRDVCRKVREWTGHKPSRHYRAWLRAPETFDLLTRRTTDAFEELVRRLSEYESRRWVRSRRLDPEQVEHLVVETIRAFLPSLEPSLAVAVSEARSEARQGEVLARIDAYRSFDDLAERLPPPTRDLLRSQRQLDTRAERVAAALAAGDPREVLSAWALAEPHWLEGASGGVRASLGLVCQALGLRSQASEFFEEAGDLGYQPQRSYASAAFDAAAAADHERSQRLLRQARQLGQSKFVDRIAAAIAEDPVLILEVGEPDLDDSLDTNVVGHALNAVGRLDEAIEVLRRSLAADSERSSAKVLLARSLLQRSGNPDALNRISDRRDALQLAVVARDERRSWRGNSVEAVELACQAAMLLGEYDQVVMIGTERPSGEAQPEEARSPEVMFAVAQAAMVLGDEATLLHIAQTSSGFHHALLQADIASQRGEPTDQIERLFRAAWSLATSPTDKFAVWMGAAQAGLDPLPGESELAHEGGETYDLCKAARHQARGELDEAKRLLRPVHASEAARRMLVGVYVAEGSIDDAVRELRDMAARFTTTDPLIRAVEILLDDGRTQQAAEIADQALRATHPGGSQRRLLHEVGVAAAHDRHAWTEMEQRLRDWIAELGPSRRTVYLRALARINESDLDGAWRVIKQFEGDATPTTPLEAQLWIVLASRFDPGAEMLAGALELIEAFEDDADVRAAGVNAFIRADREDISAGELAKWQEHLQARASADDPNDVFESIHIPDEPDRMIEALRPHLEPHVQRVTEWQEKIRREGYPVGILAAVAGRPYTAVLAHRAAGFVPFASANTEVVRREREAAGLALDLGRTVIDNSAVATGWFLPEVWVRLTTAFASVCTTGESRRDAATAADIQLQGRVGTLGWDLETQRPVLHEDAPGAIARVQEHAKWIWEQLLQLPSRDLPQIPSEERDPQTLGAWMVCFELARSMALPLWADDVGLRSLARSEGVTTFGTDSLLIALAEVGQLTSAESGDAFVALRDEFYVDLPLDEGWLLGAAAEGGNSLGPALLAVARGPFWSDLEAGLACWTRFVAAVSNRAPIDVADSVYAACLGVGSAVPSPQVTSLHAGLLSQALASVSGAATAFAATCEAAAQACRKIGLPDPVELALRILFDFQARSSGNALAARTLVTSGSELAGSHRQALRRVLFGADLGPS